MDKLQLEVGDVHILFERIATNEKDYICTCLAVKDGTDDKLVASIFEDELILSQIECHIDVKKGLGAVESLFEMLAVTIGAVDANKDTLHQLVANAGDIRKAAAVEYSSKH